LSGLSAGWTEKADTEIDGLVYELYQLSDAEIERVEARFAAELRRAA
jgi:hypothetical protein